MEKIKKVGISDISLYIPPACIPLDTIIEHRIAEQPSLGRHLSRAMQVTGQKLMRFPEAWQDSASLAAQASYQLLKNANLEHIQYLSVGTETSVDLSKPIAAYVQGMLQKSGLAIPNTLSSFQVQHACAGGTVALLSVAALLAVSRSRGAGIIACTDIARYQVPSTAEVTQGAGAVALLVEENPRLIELELAHIGYASRDVDDFFRPLGSRVAMVKGQYSMECFEENLFQAFADYANKTEQSVKSVLDQADYLVLHTPFRNMPLRALKNLVSQYLEYNAAQVEQFFIDKGVYDGIDPIAKIGNIYNGSIYLALAFLLQKKYREIGNAIIGKSILFASYGSGNTMILFKGRVEKSAISIIKNWDLAKIWREQQLKGIDEYLKWIDRPQDDETYNQFFNANRDSLLPGLFYLDSIRKDGYREYQFTSGAKEEKTLRNMYSASELQH